MQRAIIWFNHTNLTGLPLCRFTVSAKHADASAAGDASGTGGAGGASAGTGPGVCYKRLIVGPREFKTKVSTQAHFRLQLSRMQVSGILGPYVTLVTGCTLLCLQFVCSVAA